MSTAVVVGSGPNGLAAAVRLARAGVAVRVLEAADTPGGGMRTAELTLPGLLHDECSAFHPLGAGSPYFRSLGLERHGLQWLWPDVQLGHPLDGGRAGLLVRSLDETAEGLGRDAATWRRLYAQPVRSFDAVTEDALRPVAHLPRHPLALAAFGIRALPPATWTAKAFRTEEGRALFGGICAHKFGGLGGPLSTSIGIMLGAAGHAYGWPVARGGSASIAAALIAELREHGGAIETGVTMTDVREAGDADVVLLSVSPTAALQLLGDRLPHRVEKAYGHWRYGPAAFKVDYAVEGPIPWQHEPLAEAGTLHLGGGFAELAANEAGLDRGVMPERPFVLLGQQHVADPSRSAGGLNPVYAYAHVPHGYSGDAESAVTAQIERFAPGFRDRIRASVVRGPKELEAHNANYIGGDIGVGAAGFPQVVVRPRLAADPYSTGVPGVYLCSAATPPGPGVHGMAGYHAAGRALAYLASNGRRRSPTASPGAASSDA